MEPNAQQFIQSFKPPTEQEVLVDPQQEFVKNLKSQLERQDLMETIGRFKQNSNNLDYLTNDGKYDELALKHYAHKIYPTFKVDKMTTSQLLGMLEQHLDNTFDIPKMELGK